MDSSFPEDQLCTPSFPLSPSSSLFPPPTSLSPWPLLAGPPSVIVFFISQAGLSLVLHVAHMALELPSPPSCNCFFVSLAGLSLVLDSPSVDWLGHMALAWPTLILSCFLAGLGCPLFSYSCLVAISVVIISCHIHSWYLHCLCKVSAGMC